MYCVWLKISSTFFSRARHTSKMTSPPVDYELTIVREVPTEARNDGVSEFGIGIGN